MSKKATATETVIAIPQLSRSLLEVPIQSISPLIVHQFGQKARTMIREAESAGGRKKTREPRTDEKRQAEFEASVYLSEEGWHGIPCGGFRKAMIRAGKLSGVAMTDLRQMFFVKGDGVEADTGMELIKLLDAKGKPFTWDKNPPQMREDYVRVQGGTSLRYRAMYENWQAVACIEFDPKVVTPESLSALVERAGFSVGQCEWRPEKDGEFGRFEIQRQATKGRRKKAS